MAQQYFQMAPARYRVSARWSDQDGLEWEERQDRFTAETTYAVTNTDGNWGYGPTVSVAYRGLGIDAYPWLDGTVIRAGGADVCQASGCLSIIEWTVQDACRESFCPAHRQRCEACGEREADIRIIPDGPNQPMMVCCSCWAATGSGGVARIESLEASLASQIIDKPAFVPAPRPWRARQRRSTIYGSAHRRMFATVTCQGTARAESAICSQCLPDVEYRDRDQLVDCTGNDSLQCGSCGDQG